MSQQKNSWWKDPSILGDAINLVAALTAVALSILDLLGWLEVTWFQDNLTKITLILVALVVLSNFAEKRFLLNRLQGSLLDEVRRLRIGPYQGLMGVYASRRQLPVFQETIREAKKEIYIAGIEFGYIALHEIPALESKVMNGCKIKLLLVDPGTDEQPNPLLQPLEKTFNFPQLTELLKTSLNRLSHWKSELPPSVGKRVEIRVTQTIPTHIVTFMDGNSSSGRMLLEMIPPKIEAPNRWLVLIEARTGEELYQRYVTAYNLLWEQARPWG